MKIIHFLQFAFKKLFDALEDGKVEKVLDVFLERFQRRCSRLFDLDGGLNRDDSAELRNREIDKRRLEQHGFSGRGFLLSFSGREAVCILFLKVMGRIPKNFIKLASSFSDDSSYFTCCTIPRLPSSTFHCTCPMKRSFPSRHIYSDSCRPSAFLWSSSKRLFHLFLERASPQRNSSLRVSTSLSNLQRREKKRIKKCLH